MTALYMYDGAFAGRSVAAMASKPGCIAGSHYMTGTHGSTSAQPATLRAHGLGAVYNAERQPAALVGASRSFGQQFARDALATVDKDCPRDGSVAIYFSVDTEVPRNRIGACDQAFAGINDVLHGQFSVRVYGEGALIDHLVAQGLVQGKQWLSMSTAFPGFDPASPNVCLVQMHDAHGNWIGTDITGTDRNTITDPHALGAWWPDGSPYAATGDDMTPADLDQIAALIAASEQRVLAKVERVAPATAALTWSHEIEDSRNKVTQAAAGWLLSGRNNGVQANAKADKLVAQLADLHASGSLKLEALHVTGTLEVSE